MHSKFQAKFLIKADVYTFILPSSFHEISLLALVLKIIVIGTTLPKRTKKGYTSVMKKNTLKSTPR